MKKKIYLHLEAGFGNQLFQYFYAYNLKKKLNASLVLDSFTGFFFNFKHKSSFQIPLKEKINKNSICLSIKFIFFRLLKKYFLKSNSFQLFDSIFIHDKNKNFLKNIGHLKKKEIKKIYILGNFQNENYFKENYISIKNSLDLNRNILPKYKNIISKINFNKSICVGIRMWEEAKLDADKFGGITDFQFYSLAAKKIKIKNPTYYVFSTVKKQKLEKYLKLPGKVIYIPKLNNKDEYLDTFMFINKFKNFILSNSTFYWWGAYLAKKKKKIIISDKFNNKYCVPKNWVKL